MYSSATHPTIHHIIVCTHSLRSSAGAAWRFLRTPRTPGPKSARKRQKAGVETQETLAHVFFSTGSLGSCRTGEAETAPSSDLPLPVWRFCCGHPRSRRSEKIVANLHDRHDRSYDGSRPIMTGSRRLRMRHEQLRFACHGPPNNVYIRPGRSSGATCGAALDYSEHRTSGLNGSSSPSNTHI